MVDLFGFAPPHGDALSSSDFSRDPGTGVNPFNDPHPMYTHLYYGQQAVPSGLPGPPMAMSLDEDPNGNTNMWGTLLDGMFDVTGV